MGKWNTQSENWSKWVATQRYLHCLINTLNKDINLIRMSSRTHNEFSIQFPHKRLPNFANKTGLSVRQNDLWNNMKSISIINIERRHFVSGDILWYERKCAILDGKQESIKVVKWNCVPYKPMIKSIPTISQG
jgi:hypothetical protein